MLPNPLPKNILSDLNQEFLFSAEINCPDVFEGLLEHMTANVDAWLKWAQCDAPHTEKLPGDWANLTPFNTLIVLKAFRPEKLSFAMQLYVVESMGKFYAESPSVTMETIY